MVQSMNKRNLFTFNFKKNSIFIFKFFIAMCLLLFYIFNMLPQYENGYCASLIDKVNRLKSINEPKIVLLGNSNLAFGIDSKMLEESMNMPVVNMGLHGGDGNAFHEEMAKINVVSGDIYVLCHSEYADDNIIPEPMTAWSSIENHLSLWKILRVDDITTMGKAFPIYLKKCLGLYSSGTGNLDLGGCYSRSAFNEYGDVALEREGSEYTFEQKVEPSKINDTSIDRINQLNTYLLERGATLVIAGYPIGNGKLTADADEFINFQEELEKRLDCPNISNYVDYMFDYSYFYNTNLHLNSEGAKLRTMQLIKDLKHWQEKKSDVCMGEDIYADIIADVNLSHIEDIYEYLDALEKAKDRYTILIASSGDSSLGMNDEIMCRLKNLGLISKWDNVYGCSYIAVIENGNVSYENLSSEKIVVADHIDNDNMRYFIKSVGREKSDQSSIKLNGQQYCQNAHGLNFVIYSNETHRILDTVAFDTGSSNLTFKR